MLPLTHTPYNSGNGLWTAPPAFSKGILWARCCFLPPCNPCLQICVYVLLPEPSRARAALDLVTREVETHAGISANLGKTRVFNYEAGPAPPGIADLGPEVWRGSRPPQQRGFVALGTPIGTPEYVRAWGAERLEAEDTLFRQLPKLPDLQCAWLLLSFCAAPRANHALRTVPPDLLAPYTAARDAAVWGTLQACLGATAEDEACPARDIALLPASPAALARSSTRSGSGADCRLAW